jgi:hypothetical protein
MRRTALIIAIFAIIACGFGSARADAASTQRSQVAASPAPGLYGGHCVTVRSSTHNQTGTICVYVDRLQGNLRAEVVLTSRSGALKSASAVTVKLSVNSTVINAVHNAKKSATGAGRSIVLPDSWWDEPAQWLRSPKIAGAYNACMIWADGAKACTGPHWLYSQHVFG